MQGQNIIRALGQNLGQPEPLTGRDIFQAFVRYEELPSRKNRDLVVHAFLPFIIVQAKQLAQCFDEYDLAEDLIQEAITVLIDKHLPKVDLNYGMGVINWVKKCIRQSLVTYILTNRGARRKHDGKWGPVPESYDLVHADRDPDLGITENLVLTVEEENLWRKFLKCLHGHFRPHEVRIFLATKIHGLNGAQAAETTGKTRNAVENTLRKIFHDRDFLSEVEILLNRIDHLRIERESHLKRRVNEILDAVCQYYDLPLDELLSRRPNNPKREQPWLITIFLANERLGCNAEELGYCLGRSERVIHAALSKVREKVITDSSFSAAADQIRKQLDNAVLLGEMLTQLEQHFSHAV